MIRALLRLLGLWHEPDDPERLIEAVVTDIRHKLTEARLQMLAADLARKHAGGELAVDDESREGIKKLEATLKELECRRDALVAKARDADARLAIERALMEVDAEPAQVALDLVAERVNEAQAEADAIAEVREASIETRGGGDV